MIKSYKSKGSRRYDELQAFLAERRGFCPTGEGGGIDNSCNAGGGGGKGTGGGGKNDGPKKTPPPDGEKSPVLAKMIDRIAKEGKGSSGASTSEKSPVLAKMIDRIAKEGKGSGPTGGKSPMLGKILDKIDKLAKDAKVPGGMPTGGKSSVLGKMIDRIAKGEKGSGGSQSPKGGGGEKYKKPDDEDTDWLGRKTGKGPNWLGNDPKKTMEKIAESGGKVDGQLSGFQVPPKMGYDSGKKSGESLDWSKGKDHKVPGKAKEAQDFLDRAREGQLARGGKDKGKSDDGGGVQTWSKGDHFPWTTKQVGTDEGHVQGLHPDGSTTAKYPFKGDSSEATRKVIEEIKSKGKGFTAKGGVAPITRPDKPKSLEQIRLEAAGVWGKQQAEKQAAKAKSQQQKSADYHDEMQPLKDALRKNGVSWGEFATKSNSTAKSGGLGKEKTRKGSYRIAIEELKKGPEAFQAHLSKLGVKPKRSSEVLAEMTAFFMERASR